MWHTMNVRIGHAVMDENKKAKGGKPGDNNGKEVVVGNWYKEGWNVVLRPKEGTIAEKIAVAMEQACLNNAIGYNQGNRTTLYTQAVKHSFNLSKITQACECDCSSLVAVCANAAGVKVSKDIYTGNMVKALINTSYFIKLTDKKYLESSDYLKRGDILVHEGSHTAIVLDNGSLLILSDDCKEVDYFVSVTTFRLNVRSESNAKSNIITTIKEDTVVHINQEKEGWGYSETYKGWINLNYTKRNVSQSVAESYLALTTTSVNFRTSPSSVSSQNIITALSKGSYVVVSSERSDGWCNVKTVINSLLKEGWIFKDYLCKPNIATFEKRRVTDTTGLNIRTGGNVNTSCIGTIPCGKEFHVLIKNSWGLIVYDDILGYCSLSDSYSRKI